MNNKIVNSLAIAMLLAFVSSCKKDDMGDMNMSEKNINYPAAYIVIGESSTISVIKLSDNTVSETIEIMGSGGNMVMWPHHIYSHQNHMAIGVPGMDLSAGHTGGMPGMKGRVVIMDATKGTLLQNFETPLMNHNAVYSPNGTEVWTTQMDAAGKVLVYDANSFALKNTINVGDDPAEITFSTDGNKAYVCNGGSANVSIINPTTKAVITTVNVGTDPVGAWPASNGKMYVDNEMSQTISVLDVATNNVVGTINLGFMPGYAAYNSSTSELWVTDPTAGKVAYYLDMGGNTLMKHGEFATGAGAHAIGFYGNYAYITNQTANTVSIVNPVSHTVVKTLNVGKKPNGIAFKM